MKKVTQLEFEQRIKKRFPDEKFEVIKYLGMGKPATIKCLNCNTILNPATASNFLIYSKNKGCLFCSKNNLERENRLKLITHKYEIVDIKVKDTHKYYTVKCRNCGHVRTNTLANLYRNLNCGCITKVYKNRTEKELIEHIDKAQNNGKHALISEYINQSTKILIKHNDCGFIWKARPSDLIAGKSSCPNCRKVMSKGARLISKILDENEIVYVKEKLLDNSLLRFDFYIEYGEDCKYAIEYNGEQHYKENSFFNASLKVQQDRDFRKQQYCIQNSITLIEIPYTLKEQDIVHIITQLKNKLNDYSARKQG